MAFNLDDIIIDEYFNYDKSVKITRMWEIIRDMEDIVSRNLLLLYHACNCRYKRTLEELGRNNKVVYKNEATLRVMVCNARKIIREKYRELYGDN